MILDGIPALKILGSRSNTLSGEIVLRIIETLERTLGVRVMYETTRFPAGDYTLADERLTADALVRAGILKSYQRGTRPPDEPPHFVWKGVSMSKNVRQVAGGSLSSSAHALKAMLSEALERFIWREETDYFSEPRYATTDEISLAGPYLAPERFTSYSTSEREKRSELSLRADATYLWIRGTSLITGKRVYVPAQTVSGAPFAQFESTPEPLIRNRNTNGLATWPTQKGARLAGILELIERDAYAIMWLNQLTPHQISLDALRARDPRIESMLERCKRYGLTVHALKMPTDAPAHALCVIVEDRSGVAPRYAFGLRAHRSLARALEKALSEALRAREATRLHLKEDGAWEPGKSIEEIGHRDRLLYWAHENNPLMLSFLTEGPLDEPVDEAWEHDSEEVHLERLLSWCRGEQYECVAVSLSGSKRNPTKLHIEMILMPDLQPMYLHERERHLAGKRLHSVPLKLGFTAREVPFTKAPHPFS